MKTKTAKLLTLLLCFVLLIASVAVVASAVGANVPASSVETDKANGGKTAKYGDIPAGYEDKSVYPFVVYKYTNGALKETTPVPTLATAIMVSKNYLGPNQNYWDDEKGVYTGNSVRSAVILMRDSYTTKSGKYNSEFVVYQPISETNAPGGDHYDNFAQVTGEVIIDLNGYTLEQGKGTSAIFSYVTNKGFDQGHDGVKAVRETKYTIINGTLAVNDKPVVYANMWDSLWCKVTEQDGTKYYESAAPFEKNENGEYVPVAGVEHLPESMADKDFIWNFENVKFEYVDTTGVENSPEKSDNMLMTYGNYQGQNTCIPQAAAPFYFNYTNCTFDLTNAPDGATIFNAAPEEEKYLKVSVSVTGSEIIASADKLSKTTLFNVNAETGSLTLNRDIKGEYLSLAMGTTPSTSAVAVGDRYFHWTELNDNDIYTYVECTSHSNAHGICNACVAVNGTCVDNDKDNVCDTCGAEKIGDKWLEPSNAELYPFVVIKASGLVHSLHSIWGKATAAAFSMDGSTIVVRSDYAFYPMYGNTAIDVTNLKNRTGTFTVDLRGHTITRPANINGYEYPYLFDNYLDASTKKGDVKVTVKNGTLNAEWSLICLSGHANIACEKRLDFEFDNVNFKFSKNTVSSGGWAIVAHANKEYAKTIRSDMLFKDCTFDLTEINSSWNMNNVAAIDVDTATKSGADFLKVNVTFEGGRIIANRLTNRGFMQLNSDDILTLKTGKDGKYLTLELPAGQVPGIPTEASMFTLSDGSRVYFHKNGDVYNLSTCVEQAGVHTCICGIAMSVCRDADNNDFCDQCNRVYGYIANTYGITNIDPMYASVDTYPFFVLMYQNGVYTFKTATKTLYGHNGGSASAMGYAVHTLLDGNNQYDLENKEYKPLSSSSGVVDAIIVMRRDYSVKIGKKVEGQTTPDDEEYFDNIAHAQGHVIMDLGGYTLSEASGSKNGIFAVTSKGWNGGNNGVYTFPAYYTFKNGSLRVHTYALARLSVWDHVENPSEENEKDYPGEWFVKDHPFNVTFDNVTIGYTEGATANILAFYAKEGTHNYGYTIGEINVDFNNCVFDLITNVPNKNINIIETATQDKYYTNFQTKFTNCEILTSDISKISVYDTPTSANGTAVTLIKDANGSYMTLTMPAGSTPPALDKNVTLKDGVLCEYNTPTYSDGYVHYQLSPDVLVGYKITTNVTLHTNFIYNMYVPTANVTAFTVNGKSLTLGEKITVNGMLVTLGETTTVNGVECYAIKVDIPVAETLQDITLVVTLESGDGTVNATYNLGIYEYAKALLDGDYIEITKTLTKDMLLYAYQAQKFFAKGEVDESVSAKLSEIEEILSTYYRRLPNGISRVPTEGYITKVELNVGKKPAFRFYLADGIDASKFSFTANGTPVTKENVIGTNEGEPYLEVIVPAYIMLHGIGIKYDGTSIGSYNLFAYYDHAVSLRSTMDFTEYVYLVATVEGLMKYCDSANDYATYIGNGGFGSMKLEVPAKIYPGVPGMDVTALFTNGDYYGNVNWSTNNPNVYIQNGKIYAVGEFATDTEVEITATTEHHTESATVTVVSSTSQTYKYIENATSDAEGGEINTTGWYVYDDGNNLIGDYSKFVIRGKLNVYSFGKSELECWPQIQFRFKTEPIVRFLFEDKDGNGIFTLNSNTEAYDFKNGVNALEWAVVVEGTNAYFYIGGKHVKTCDVTGAEYFNLGVLCADALFYDVELYTKKSNPTEYTNLSSKYTSGNMQDYGTLYIDAPSKVYPGAPAVDISANCTLPSYNGAVTWTTDNANVIIADGKISATGTFANDTYVTITAKTEHHTATTTVLIPGTSSQSYKYVENLNSTSSTLINDTGIFIKENGKNITGEFVVTGKINIYAYNSSTGTPHLQLRFTKLPDKTIVRFYMSPNANGVFKFYDSETDRTYNLNDGVITLDFAVVVVDKTAHLYIDGILEATLDVSKDEYFNLGALRMNVLFYDIELYTKANNEAAYNNAVAEYLG